MNTDSDRKDETAPEPVKLPRRGVGARLRAYFLAGILITAPISITFYLAWLFIGFVDRQVTPFIPEAYNPNTYLPFALPGLGIFVIAVFLTLVGAFTAGFLGRFVVRTGERILARMPVIRSVYGAFKQIFETVLAQQSNAFREAVLVEYPRRGVWAIATLKATPPPGAAPKATPESNNKETPEKKAPAKSAAPKKKK